MKWLFKDSISLFYFMSALIIIVAKIPVWLFFILLVTVFIIDEMGKSYFCKINEDDRNGKGI
jgi:ABC-type microcin C transport system permease subunit YejB